MSAFWSVVAVGAALALLGWWRRREARLASRARLTAARPGNRGATQAVDTTRGIPSSGVARWLYLAGFRRPGATRRFWGATVGLAIVGLLLGLLVQVSGLGAAMRADLEGIPGRVGFVLVPIVVALPVLVCLGLAALPTVRVRRARRRRVREILADLYPSLELFASLAQAGLAFDAALARVVGALGTERPLARELLAFQAEVQSGADRSACLRRLARRIELPQVSSFTAALIRSHEAGIGLSSVMRRQADDLRQGLREQALARAQSLPARLVFPLVICFLPGVFVMSLGPAFYGFLVETSGFGSNE